MPFSFKEDYWDDPQLKNEFIGFLKQIFGLDLTLWNDMGYWDRLYRPFSFFDGDRLVSNVCIYSMDMMVMGKRSKVAQVSAVGTLPEYQRRGLSTQLIERAMEWAEADHEFFYLFADENAYPFYKKCGFRIVSEFKPRIAVSGKAATPGAVKLDISKPDDLELIERFAKKRSPVSNQLGVLNDKLLMFWCVYFLSDCIYHIPDLDIVLIYRRNNGLLTISEIIGRELPNFADIYPCISDASDRSAEYLFMTDKLGLENVEFVKVEGNGTHLLGTFPLQDRPAIFPLTSHA